MRTRELGIFTAVVLGSLLLPRLASAQEWLKDRRYAEGVGIKAGDFEVHPGVAGEIGYDSNYFLRSQKSDPNNVNAAPQNPVQGAGMLRVTPSLYLSTISQQRETEAGTPTTPPNLRFRGGLSATYREFLFNSALTNQRNVSGAADANLEILPERPWGGALNASYMRTIQPTVLGDPNLSFNRDDVSAGATVITRPGGGTLDWQFGYQFHDTIFEDAEGQGLDNITHEAATRGRWKFRPKTALMYDATLRFISYTNPSNNPGGLHDSTPVRTRVGLNGLITPRLALLAIAGYGGSFYNTTNFSKVQQYDSLIGQLEAKFFITPNPGTDPAGTVTLALSSVAVGFTRDFQNSYLGDFYGSDKGYVKLSYFFAGRALVSFDGALGSIEYPTIFNPDGTPRAASFTDIRAEATLFGEYRFSDTFGLNATMGYAENFSSTRLTVASPTGAPGAQQFFDMNWQRFQAFLGARWFM
jgi:hypothetical protein